MLKKKNKQPVVVVGSTPTPTPTTSGAITSPNNSNMWANAGSGGVITTYGTTTSPYTVTGAPSNNTYYISSAGAGNYEETNLNEYENFYLASEGPALLNNLAIMAPLQKNINYSLIGPNYRCFIEQDFTNLPITTGTIRMVRKLKKRFGVLALDLDLNRLELASILPEDDANANMEMLLNDDMSIKNDKSEFIATLYGRTAPFVNAKNISMTQSSLSIKHTSLGFEPDTKVGLLPIVHLTNLVFGGITNVSKKEMALALDKLNTEVLLLDKATLSPIQKYFSPEYGYLTLKSFDTIKQKLRQHNNYTKSGLLQLLTDICIDGSNPSPFLDELLNCMSLDQRILNIEDRANVIIRNLIEQNID